MGNVFSKPPSLRDLLLNLDEKITAIEESINSYENTKYSLNQYLYIFFILVIPLVIIIFPAFGKISLIYACILCAIIYLIKKVYEVILNGLINKKKSKLKAFKEVQKKE